METQLNESQVSPSASPGSPTDTAWIAAADWVEIARLLLTSRALDRIEETELFPSGKITYQFSARGHELAQILLSFAMVHARDAATVYYRSRPFLLASGLTAEQAFASSLGRVGSLSAGRDVGVVFSLPPREFKEGGPRRGRATVLPAVGDVGGQYTPAAGWSQSVLYRKNVLKDASWAGAMAVALGGDGSVATNGFWSALTLITTLTLPCLLFIEDNGFTTSVPSTIQTPGGNIAENLASFKNLTILDVDGADPAIAADAIGRAVAHVRRGAPCLLRVSVPRLQGHSVFDTQVYKTAEQKQREEARDPLPRLRSYLAERRILSTDDWAAMEASVQAEVIAARDAAMAQPEPDPSTAKLFTFYEPHRPQIVGGTSTDNASSDSSEDAPDSGSTGPLSMRNPHSGSGPVSVRGPASMRGVESMAPLTMNAAIKRTLEVELRNNPRVLIFGQDVGPMGGLYGTTTSLQARFGLDRVFDTSLSEDGIVGRAIGMALAGLMPVTEIQCRKYADAGTEQINNCGSIRWRTAGKFAAPMVIRIPCGVGKLTGDPWHCLTAESVFAHSAGLKVAFPSSADDAVGLLRTALRGNDPTIFLEHRALLYAQGPRRYWPGEDHVVPFGVARTLQRGSELTIVTWGESVHRVLSVTENYWDRVEVIDLRSIAPWDKQAVLDSVHKTHKCMIVHEDTLTCGFGAEIAATIAQERFMDLEAPIVRLATSDQPVPYNQGLMNALAPSVDSIRKEIDHLLSF